MADTRKAEQETIEGARAAKQREMKDLQKKLVTETDGGYQHLFDKLHIYTYKTVQ